MTKLSIERMVLGGFGAAVAVLVLISGMAWHSMNQSAVASDRVRYTHEVLTTLEQIMSSIYRAEMAQRDYRIDPSAAYLKSRDKALLDADQAVRKATQLTAGNPGQQLRLARVRQLFARRVELFSYSQTLRDKGITTSPQFGQGAPVTEQMREVIDQMASTENRVLREREAEDASQKRVVRTSFALLLASLTVILILIFLRIRHDIRLREQADAEREARRTAEAANQAKSEFLANMSHELRTPLNGILGYAQILLRDNTLGERQGAGLRVIQQSGEQLLTLINDVLDFAKIEAGKQELSLTDIPLARFLRIIAEIISVKAEQKGLVFICDTAPDLPGGIRADEKRLRQALLNLLANAVKFTDRGQVSLRVRFSPPARLRFEVQDTGIGIREEQLESIFQPFEQGGEAQRRLGGSGLGLAISQRFVRLMGGDIKVESRIGQGSTFWFELELPVVEAETAPAPAEGVVTGYQGPRKKVLIVDDVAENRAVLVDMLGQIGFEMAEAESGSEGLEKAQALRPDLILMDIVMPEMDGLEATRRLRQLPAQKDVPVIAISASTSGGDKESSLAAGMNTFLPKPIDLGTLLAQIASLLKLNWTYKLPPAGPSQEHDAPGRLLAPPAQEMEILHRLALEGNMRDIVQRAAYLAELDERYRPFADQLRLLAKGYQSKAILGLVERHLERKPAP